MTTAKEVNPLLYAMRSKHLLSFDGQRWSIYRSSQEGQELGMRGQGQFGEVRGQGSGRSRIRIRWGQIFVIVIVVFLDFLLDLYILFYVYECIACMYVHHMHVVPAEGRRGN